MNIEEAYEIISIIGKDNVEKIHGVIGGRRISFANLKRLLLHEEIIKEINDGNNFSSIAKKWNVSKMTVYRIFEEVRKK